MSRRIQLASLPKIAGDAVTGPGLWAAAAALLAQRFLHAAVAEAPFAPYAAAEWIIRKTPGPIATEGIERLGHNAQHILAWSFVAFTLLIGLALSRRPAWLLATAALVLTLVASYLDPLSRDVGWSIASGLLAGATAYLAVVILTPNTAPVSENDTDFVRRRLLAGGALALVFVGTAGSALIRRGVHTTPNGPVRADIPVTIPNDPAFAEVAGLSPKMTTRQEHYVVDIDYENPYIDALDWELKVDGVVVTPRAFSFEDLQQMETEERLFNLSCISNRVGGHLIGNSRWTGVSLDTLLDAAGIATGAVTLVAHSDDGYHEGIPLDEIVGQGALVAIGMNGRLLPQDHGYPARLLFPNHYGMRSVKWLTRIEVLDHDEEGYWASRGWDRDAVVRTMSRIDAPGDSATVPGTFVVAGIAWAGARRISAVDVSPDGGNTWQPAQLEAELSPLSWRRWQVALDLPPGDHRVLARATDGDGMVQDRAQRDPHPSGASGYHSIKVTVA